MTSGRFGDSPGAALLLAALALNTWGCSGSTGGCVQCPPMAGRYALAFGDGSDSADCKSAPVSLPQGPLDVTQEGDALSADLNGLTLRGTLYQTYDFTLLGLTDTDGGLGPSDSQSLNGRYVPVVTDGGVPTLVGEFQADATRTTGAGTLHCTMTRSFTATRQ